MEIKDITAQKILASLGDETVEATIEFEDGTKSSASIPAGLSAGKYEVPKVDPTTAIVQINDLKKALIGKDWTQESLDGQIGLTTALGNATLAISAAFYKAALQLPPSPHFPKLMLLLFEGGLHGNPKITAQEFLLIEDTITQAKEDYAKLKKYLIDHKVETLVGAEGGFSPQEFDDTKVRAVIAELFPNQPLGVDVAGSFNSESFDLSDLFSVEDPYDDESWDKFQKLNAQGKLLVIGDDLTATNPERIKRAVDLKAIGGAVIKPNQIGTITAAKEAVRVAREGDLKIIVSHRGEDTDDTWIADFAIDVAADFVKFGGLERGERVAKLNRLLEMGAR